MEDKKLFIIGEALINHARTGVTSLDYVVVNNMEYVVITYSTLTRRQIHITGSSCVDIMGAIAKALIW